MSKAKITHPFLSCHIQGLSPKVITTIRAAYQPGFTDGDDNINDLFHVNGLKEWLDHCADNPDECSDAFSPIDCKEALNALDIEGLDKYRYISIETAD